MQSKAVNPPLQTLRQDSISIESSLSSSKSECKRDEHVRSPQKQIAILDQRLKEEKKQTRYLSQFNDISRSNPIISSQVSFAKENHSPIQEKSITKESEVDASRKQVLS